MFDSGVSGSCASLGKNHTCQARSTRYTKLRLWLPTMAGFSEASWWPTTLRGDQVDPVPRPRPAFIIISSHFIHTQGDRGASFEHVNFPDERLRRPHPWTVAGLFLDISENLHERGSGCARGLSQGLPSPLLTPQLKPRTLHHPQVLIFRELIWSHLCQGVSGSSSSIESPLHIL